VQASVQQADPIVHELAAGDGVQPACVVVTIGREDRNASLRLNACLDAIDGRNSDIAEIRWIGQQVEPAMSPASHQRAIEQEASPPRTD